MKKGKKKGNAPIWAEKLSHSLGVPTPVLPGVAMIQLMGNRECIVEGCQGILEYGNDVIKLNIGSSILTFCGEGLSLRALNEDGAVVEGLITNLSFTS